MVLSYSKVAQPTADTPEIISIATPKTLVAEQPLASPVAETQELPTESAPVTETPSEATTSTSTPRASQNEERTQIQHLILDAGPLLSFTPLRHLATSFHTTPLVLAELRDPKAREHWEKLGLSGVDVKVEPPTAEAMFKVTEFAKKTGDFAVLSQTDLSVAALTYQYEVLLNGDSKIRTHPGQKLGGKGKGKEMIKPAEDQSAEAVLVSVEDATIGEVTQAVDQIELGAESQPQEPIKSSPNDVLQSVRPEASSSSPLEDVEDDGGEWITPSNLNTHRSRDLGLITPSGSTAKPRAVTCMTGDYAVQNILLGMGLGLVGEGGKKIGKVKSWVLRCHACFKICKDPSKRFCPSCGNATLIRTTVSTSAKTGEQQVHLKQNFQYRTRGTIYSIPDPKMGRAKGQQKGGSGLILREDQREWQDALRGDRIKREKEERKVAKGALDGWNDPDWMPEIISVGMSGKGRSGGQNMPNIGHGRKNPNQAKRRR